MRHAELNHDLTKLLWATSRILLMRIAATVIAFVASLVYARALGPESYGVYSIVIAWMMFLTVFASLGLPQYAIREAARHGQFAPRLRLWAEHRVLVSGSVAALVLISIGLIYADRAPWHLYLLAAPLPVLNLLASLRRSILQGRGHAEASLWPEQLLMPLVMLASVIVLWHTLGTLTPAYVLASMVLASVVLALVSRFQFVRLITPAQETEIVAVAGDQYPSLTAARPYLWLALLIFLNGRLDLLFVGSLLTEKDAGIYAVAMRGAELIAFIAIAANITLGPKIAQLHHERALDAISGLTSRTAVLTTLMAAPLALLLILFGSQVLDILYGNEYAAGGVAMAILAAGQLASVVLGPAGLTLNMTEHAALSVRALLAGVILNAVLNAILIPRFGIEGAAMASATGLLSCNILRWHWTRSYLGIDTLAIRRRTNP